MSLKVLVIDDDPDMTQLIKYLLRGQLFEVHTVNSSIEGVEAARQLKPDVIVLDLMMPGMNGWEVCRQIRTFSQVPILVLSVIAEQHLLKKSIDDGANDYLSKPVTRKTLISHLQQLTKSASNNLSPVAS